MPVLSRGSDALVNLSINQLKQKLSLMKLHLIQYGLPKSPTPVGISKFNFICKLKIRLCMLPLGNASYNDLAKVLYSLLDFLEPEIIDKQLRRERVWLLCASAQLDRVNFVINDSRLVAIGRKLFPGSVERLEARVTHRFKQNRTPELLLLTLKDYSSFNYLMAYTMSEHVLINQLKSKLDKSYYAKRQSGSSNEIVQGFFERVAPEVYRNKLLREGGENIDYESTTISVARSLFPHRVNKIEKSAKAQHILSITRRRLDSH
jgi:hypothetical protein